MIEHHVQTTVQKLFTYKSKLNFTLLIGSFSHFCSPSVLVWLHCQKIAVLEYWVLLLFNFLLVSVCLLSVGHASSGPSDCRRKKKDIWGKRL